MNSDPTHPPILVLGHSESAMRLRQPDHRIAAALSIHGHGEFPLSADGITHFLSLQFDDAEVFDPADPESAHRAWVAERAAREVGRPVRPPRMEDARAIVEFAQKIRAIDGFALFTCFGGISRSSAAALISLAAWTGGGAEDYCAEQLFRARPAALPHAGPIRFGDQFLQRRGRLITAVSMRLK